MLAQYLLNDKKANMQNQKLKAITNLFEGNEIRSIWNNEKDIEEKLGKKVINSKNNLNYKYIENNDKI